MGISDSDWMQLAWEQALLAKKSGEVPVGAVLIDADGRLLSCAHNQVLRQQDPCAHAEILAIREAAATLNNYRLEGCSLYVTLEPCAMCAGAMVHARLKRLIFSCRDFKTGAAGSVHNLLRGYPLNHRILIDEGIMQNACGELLKDFFRERRQITLEE